MDQNSVVLVLLLGLRIVGGIVCNSVAKTKNRNAIGWSFAGFFFPIVAIIWVSCLGDNRTKFEATKTLKQFTNFYTKIGTIEVENTGERKVFVNGKPAISGTYKLNNSESINVIDGKIHNQNL